uniref:Ent-atiserene synthase n=1 Tax=Aconitum carmichaelii TaxID=85363 RepID=A0A8E8P2S0_ACOCM|nr:ent-atiserene synthase [Aconitum carmichaelii]
MYLSHPSKLLPVFPNPTTTSRRRSCSSSISAVSVNHNVTRLDKSEKSFTISQETKERITKIFNKVQLSKSSYDTAWVAMVPSLDSSLLPYFPECLNWILENQHPDGSWGLTQQHPLLLKDTLSSTLACMLALKRWNIGEDHVNKALHFITSKFASATDEKQRSPIGFDIIFPGMIEYAQEMGINFHLGPTGLNSMLYKRDMELHRISTSNSEGTKLYRAYVAEGFGKSQDWEELMKYQRKNGSLFNSPSTTAVAAAHLQDPNCFKYLNSILEEFGNAVPTTYPLDIYTQLCMVDSLERLGISPHFKKEIGNVLDKTYNSWLTRDEEIFLDVSTSSMAFRILRVHGYDVSSDALAQFDEEGFSNTLGGYLRDAGAVLEVYRASQIVLPDEVFLEKQKTWSSAFLKNELSKVAMHADRMYEWISNEVDMALTYPYKPNLPRVEHRRTVEHYNFDNLRILKSSYRPLGIDNKDLLHLAMEDFNLCQLMYQNEFKELERWVKENRIDKLKFARQKQVYTLFSSAATLFPPELSDARLSWAKFSILTTVIDDCYDLGGSREELINLNEVFDKWDGVTADDFISEPVEILYNAYKNTINDLAQKAFKYQHRDISKHLVQICVEMIKSMWIEAEWMEHNIVPSLDEYNTNGYVSFALGPIVLTTLYFVGPKLSEEVVKSSEYHELFRLMSTICRNLNDLRTVQKELSEGTINGVSILMIHDPDVKTEEDSMNKIKEAVDICEKELIKLVLQRKDSVVPRACKELFWNMIRINNLFYASIDGYTSETQMMNEVKAVMRIPLTRPDLVEG